MAQSTSYQGCTYQNMIEIKQDEESREKTWNVPMLLRKVRWAIRTFGTYSRRPCSTSTDVLWHYTPSNAMTLISYPHIYPFIQSIFLTILYSLFLVYLVFVNVKHPFGINMFSSNMFSSNMFSSKMFSSNMFSSNIFSSNIFSLISFLLISYHKIL